jgi:arylsulfatase A-like enzyme
MTPITRRSFLAAASAMAAADSKPNILFIMADDLGIGNVGRYGSTKIKTPNIDRLASEGMRFTDAYTGASVCAPSRSCLMTGQHTGHTRVRANHSVRTKDRVPLLTEDTTVAEVLKSVGYATGITGKWGLGEPGTTGVPNRQGFDEWFGFLNQDHAVDYYTDHLWRNEQKEILKGNLNGKHEQYVTDLFTEDAKRFIGKHSREPFFFYLAYTTPHADLQVPDDAPYTNEPWAQEHKNYAAMVTRMDRDIGSVLAHLDKLNLREKTLVFFTSDNGAGHKRGIELFRSTLHFRGAKGDVYEGGQRTPMIARWPGKIKAGSVSRFPWAFWDFLPTAAELAGAKAPPKIDGISVVPVLFGGQPKQQREYLYWEAFIKNGFQQAARVGDWKAVRPAPGAPIELYDLAKDESETTNVAAQHPQWVAKMESILRTARTETEEYPTRLSSNKRIR